MSRGILDTSVVIDLALGIELATMPTEATISVVTLCELHHGVLSAGDDHRARRLATLVAAERRFQALPLDARVAPHYGRMIAAARKTGRRPRTNDLLIAATAAAHDVPVYTRDRDFLGLDGVEVVLA
ncbi:MAG TPA: PIN domain-containing protein [Conexibacter sp.]|nr:PIN domain-containing protein [Conexibacter sp.]